MSFALSVGWMAPVSVLTSVSYAQERDFDSVGWCIGQNYSESPVWGIILLRSANASDLEFKKQQHCCSGGVLWCMISFCNLLWLLDSDWEWGKVTLTSKEVFIRYAVAWFFSNLTSGLLNYVFCNFLMIFEFQSKLIIITRNSPDKSTHVLQKLLYASPPPVKEIV